MESCLLKVLYILTVISYMSFKSFVLACYVPRLAHSPYILFVNTVIPISPQPFHLQWYDSSLQETQSDVLMWLEVWPTWSHLWSTINNLPFPPHPSLNLVNLLTYLRIPGMKWPGSLPLPPPPLKGYKIFAGYLLDFCYISRKDSNQRSWILQTLGGDRQCWFVEK